MKKYSKVIIFSVIMIVTWSIFYIQLQSVTGSLPQYEIKKIAGEEAVIEKVIIEGDVFPSYGTIEPFRVTQEGTTYMREHSLFERTGLFYQSEAIKQLQKNYRSFMRGKDEYPNSYTWNEDKIVYAAIDYSRFGIMKGTIELSTYDIATKKTQNMTVDAPDLFEYASIERVISVDDEAYVVVSNQATDFSTEKSNVEYHIYGYDFANDTAQEPTIITIGEVEAYNNLFNSFVDNETNPTELIVSSLMLEYDETIIDPERDEAIVDSARDEATMIESFEQESVKLINLTKLNLATKEVTPIDVDTVEHLGMPIAYNGEKIIFVKKHIGELTYSAYDVMTKQTTEHFTVSLEHYVSYFNLAYKAFASNYVYTVLSDEASGLGYLVVIDTDSVELAYKGKIENVSETLMKEENMSVYFNGIEVLN